MMGLGAEAPPDAGGLPLDMLAGLGPAPEEAPSGALHGGGAAPGNPEDFYRQALDALEQGIKADVDETRIQTMLQVMGKVQGELAASQKGMDGLAGGKLDPSALRRLGAPDQAY